MGLSILVLGLCVFLGTHVFVSFRGARADVVARIGLPAYRGLFALASLVGTGGGSSFCRTRSQISKTARTVAADTITFNSR
jgi:hypothetical protein